MDYKDPYNFPELAIRNYDVVGSTVTPDLFHGSIFRVTSVTSFSLGRLRNQIVVISNQAKIYFGS